MNAAISSKPIVLHRRPRPAAAPKPLELGGFTPLSTTDWPDRLAAVVFLQGCPWRCSYCHNPGLQARRCSSGPQWPVVLETLQRRVGLIDGVVFSGGEPTVHGQLGQAIGQIRQLGFQAGLHTAGIYPDKLAAVLPQLDWVGFDLKTDFAAYEGLTARRHSGARARKALDHLLASGVAHEIRTTYHPSLISDAALMATARTLKSLGVRHWVLQSWRPADEAAMLLPPWHWPGEAMLEALRIAGPALALR